MTRWRITYDSGFNAEAEARQAFRERMAELRESMQDRPLRDGERPTQSVIAPVPEQVRLSDDPILAQWVATNASLRDWRLAMRVIQRFPVVEVMERGGELVDSDVAKQAIIDLRAGKAVATSTVVRLARQRLETE